jgi:hypothetical protein
VRRGLPGRARGLPHRLPAGAAYRALVDEAQHDPTVAQLIASEDVLGDTARAVLERAIGPGAPGVRVAAQLVGPAFSWVLSGRDPTQLGTRESARALLAGLGPTGG